MVKIVSDNTPPAAMNNPKHEFWKATKGSDYIENIMREYSKALQIAVPLRKGQYSILVESIPSNEILPEIKEKLDAIYEIANKCEKIA